MVDKMTKHYCIVAAIAFWGFVFASFICVTYANGDSEISYDGVGQSFDGLRETFIDIEGENLHVFFSLVSSCFTQLSGKLGWLYLFCR
jgi:hypothetical protein